MKRIFYIGLVSIFLINFLIFVGNRSSSLDNTAHLSMSQFLLQPFIPFSPSVGEVWEVGKKYEIKWQSAVSESVHYVKIGLYKGRSLLKIIASSAVNDGTHQWTIPATVLPGTDYKIRVSKYGDSSIYGESGTFEIKLIPQGITVTSPNTGAAWEIGKSNNITWTSSGSVAMTYVKIDLYKGITLLKTITSPTVNDGTHQWTIPTKGITPGTDYKIRVSKYGNPAIFSESSTFEIKDPYLIQTECVKLFGTTDPAKAMNIFFAGFAYDISQIFCPAGGCDLNNYNKILENDVYRLLYNENLAQGYGLFTIEPFKSRLNKINVYLLNKPLKERVNVNPYTYVFDEIWNLVKNNCKEYSPNNPIHFITDKEVGGGGGTVSGSYRIPNSLDKSKIADFIHEIGHNFGLSDIYSPAYDPYGAHSMMNAYSVPNCDNTAGCPKWCSGIALSPFSVTCTNYKTKSKCELHSQNEFCLWIDEQLPEDPYFKSRCITNNDSLDHNIGTSCLAGTGCYWGCSGYGYRPIAENNFANLFSQKLGADGTKHTYDPVSERFIGDIFECCYPNSCANYDSAKCKEFSQKYFEYSSCNVCR